MAASSKEVRSGQFVFQTLEEIKQQLQSYVSIFNFNAAHKEEVSSLLLKVEKKKSPVRALSFLISKLLLIKTSSEKSRLLGIQRECLATLVKQIDAAKKKNPSDMDEQHSVMFNIMITLLRKQSSYLYELLGAMTEASKQRVFEQVDTQGWNALMAAARYNPEVVTPLLQAMPEASKQNVFEQANEKGWNALMAAARYNPEVVTPLLQALPDVSKQKVFEQANKHGWNALMIAEHHQPNTVSPLLQALPEASKQKVFEQVDTQGWNALMAAAGYHPKAVAPLLQAMPEASKQKVFEQANEKGWNALMAAARYNPEVVTPLLQALPDVSKQKVFEQASEKGWNALMIAAHHQPKAVAPLLQAMPEASKQKVFEQVDTQGWNALIAAARYHPKVVTPLLQAMPEASKQKVFEQVDTQGWNALMAAARYHPKAVAPLLQAMPKASKQKVFEQANEHGWNALTLAARHQPKAVADLVNTIREIDDFAAQTKIFEQLTTQKNNALNLAPKNSKSALLIESAMSYLKEQQISKEDIKRSQISQFVHELTGVLCSSVEKMGDSDLFTITLSTDQEKLTAIISLFKNFKMTLTPFESGETKITVTDISHAQLLEMKNKESPDKSSSNEISNAASSSTMTTTPKQTHLSDSEIKKIEAIFSSYQLSGLKISGNCKQFRVQLAIKSKKEYEDLTQLLINSPDSQLQFSCSSSRPEKGVATIDNLNYQQFIAVKHEPPLSERPEDEEPDADVDFATTHNPSIGFFRSTPKVDSQKTYEEDSKAGLSAESVG